PCIRSACKFGAWTPIFMCLREGKIGGSYFGLRRSVINCATEEVRFALEVVHDGACLPVAVHQIRTQIWCMDTSTHVFARGQDWLRGSYFGLRRSVINCATEEVRS